MEPQEETYSFSWLLLLCAFVLIAGVLYRNYCRGSRLPARRKQGNELLIIGPSGSGKTTLLYKIAQNKVIDTLSSLKENEALVHVQIEEEAPPTEISMVDIPGHGQFSKMVMERLESAKGILFMIDSAQR